MPEVRYGHAACVIGSDIYVFGGKVTFRQVQSTVIKFDTEDNEWSTLAPMPHDCSCHSACVMGGLVFITGAGANGCDVLRFDPTSAVCSRLAPTLNCREDGVSFVLNGCLYTAGGQGQPDSVERYDVVSNTWRCVVDMLEGRKFFGVVTIGSAGPAGEQNLFDSLIVKACRQHP
jgi:hypothetical protein